VPFLESNRIVESHKSDRYSICDTEYVQPSQSTHKSTPFLLTYPSGESGLRVAKPEEAFSSMNSNEDQFLELNRIVESQKSESYSICDTDLSSVARWTSPTTLLASVTMHKSIQSENRENYSMCDKLDESGQRVAKPEEASSSLYSNEDPFLELNRIVESQKSESYSICDTDLSSVTRWTSSTTSVTMHRSIQSQNRECYSICDQLISIQPLSSLNMNSESDTGTAFMATLTST
jgi:hypothetical protein